jgi:exonuclease SbcD
MAPWPHRTDVLNGLSDPRASVVRVKLLHTSDWHLGHTLKDVPREHEHAAFLAWLLEVCAREKPDVVVITGDVFDSATPTASAERKWFEFLARVRREVVVIAGNHDSPARLGAASPVLRELGVHVVGSLPADPWLELAGGGALVAAVPFLRPHDLGDATLEAIYGRVFEAGCARQRPGQALIALGHLHVMGSAESPSERHISIGGLEAASHGVFPPDLDYVALGHMHKAQCVGRSTIRYAGSPIPLSFDEAPYRHQVEIIDFERGRVREIRAHAVPRLVELSRIIGPLEAVLAAIDALPPAGDPVDVARPYLEVVVVLARPEPRLRALLETALDGKRPRLVAFRVAGTGHGGALAERLSPGRRLAELDPRDVFAQCWAKQHAEPPGAAIVGAFDRLLADVEGLS